MTTHATPLESYSLLEDKPLLLTNTLSGRPYLTSYVAENFVNWHTEGNDTNVRSICEEVDVIKEKFQHERVEQYRIHNGRRWSSLLCDA